MRNLIGKTYTPWRDSCLKLGNPAEGNLNSLDKCSAYKVASTVIDRKRRVRILYLCRVSERAPLSLNGQRRLFNYPV